MTAPQPPKPYAVVLTKANGVSIVFSTYTDEAEAARVVEILTRPCNGFAARVEVIGSRVVEPGTTLHLPRREITKGVG